MNARILTTLASISLLAGCIVNEAPPSGGGGGGGVLSGGGGGTAVSGNITFSWTFAGKSCSQAGVTNVQITIPGETLENNGVYSCSTGGYDGIVLNNFVPATYAYTVDGLDGSSKVIYSGTGNVSVNGDVSVIVNLAGSAVVPSTGTAYLTWAFPPMQGKATPTCADERVVTMDLSVDGAQATPVPCANGQTASGYQTAQLSPGSHTVALDGVDANGVELFATYGNIQITQGDSAAFSFTLQALGGVNLSWNLVNRSGQAMSCSTAGLSALSIQLYDNQGAYFASPAPQVTCDSRSGLLSVLPGTYSVVISGTGSGGTSFTSSATSPAAVTVQAGVFPTTPLQITVTEQ